MDVYIVGKGHRSTPNPIEECLKKQHSDAKFPHKDVIAQKNEKRRGENSFDYLLTAGCFMYGT